MIRAGGGRMVEAEYFGYHSRNTPQEEEKFAIAVVADKGWEEDATETNADADADAGGA